MVRTSLVIPVDLKRDAMNEARRLGISFGEYVRRALRDALNGRNRDSGTAEKASLFESLPVWHGDAPTDLALNHDKYLQEAMDEETARWQVR